MVKSFFYISGKNWYICGNFFLHNVDHLFTFVVNFYICGQYFHICGEVLHLWEFLHLMVKHLSMIEYEFHFGFWCLTSL